MHKRTATFRVRETVSCPRGVPGQTALTSVRRGEPVPLSGSDKGMFSLSKVQVM